jgi:hypothetical protein
MLKQLVRSSKPVVVVTALVAVLGITGTAYSAKLITGLDVRDGSLTAADLSKTAKASLHGGKGDRGGKGDKGARGAAGASGAAGTHGISGGFGLTGSQGPTGPPGPIGLTGAASTVVGPEGPPGPGGSTQGQPCTVPGPHTGTISWAQVPSTTTWTMTCINAV